MKLCSIQPFSLAGAGGGPRIMASMLEEAPVEVLAVCTAPRREAAPKGVREAHVPSRPRFGRLESTRLNRYFGIAELAVQREFQRRLADLLEREKATAVHAIAHGADFAAAYSAAQELSLPLFLSVHDDPLYTMRRRPGTGFALRRLGEAWREATQRFVISSEMAETMGERFGGRPYVLVTDGLEEVAAAPRTPPAGRLRAYFMGAFHLAYRSNMETFVAGAARWQRRSGRAVDVVMRSGPLPERADLDPEVSVEFRDWTSQAGIDRDLAEVDFLYLPLPFGAEHEPFVRNSLSTKLVTYLGSGLPILFHGPHRSAACELLEEAGAVAVASSLDPADVAIALETVSRRGEELAEAGLRLARERFDLGKIRGRFWSAIAPECVLVR